MESLTKRRAATKGADMLSAFRQSLLAVFAVLLLLGGIGHQIGGRFVAHDHGTAECCGKHAGDEHDDHSTTGDKDSPKPCDHVLCGHGTLACVETPMRLPERIWTVVAHQVDWGTLPSEAEPLGIEHPPQLS